MSKKNREEQFIQAFRSFVELNPKEILNFQGPYSEYDGPNLAETKTSLQFCIDVIERLLDSGMLTDVPWHTLNSLQSVLQSVHTFFQQFSNSKDQGSFQNMAMNVDSLAYHLRMFDLPFLVAGGGQVERLAMALNSETERLRTSRIEVDKLQFEVQALIAPAVAGSLSEAFTARRNTLLRGRVVWGMIALVVGGYCITATYDFAAAVGNAMAAATAAKTDNGNIVWLAVLIRSTILIPLFAAFGFSFSQYRKERDFEEEYAHKAAVATSLPNYGDLTREPAVRDQIVTGATNVIFTSPTAARHQTEKSDKTIHGIKDLVDSIGKLVPKSE